LITLRGNTGEFRSTYMSEQPETKKSDELTLEELDSASGGSKWELAELDASKNEIAIETLEITHKGFKPAKP
jgi:hypothetical protein